MSQGDFATFLSSTTFSSNTARARTATIIANTHADTTPGAAAGLPSAAHMLKLAASTIVRAT